MTILMEPAIIRIHRENGPVLGVGFLVTNRYIVTCAHVVSDALGVSGRTEEMPAKPIHLDFPLVAPEQLFKGQVVLWQPVADVAGLELTGSPPAAVQPTRLLKTDDVWGHTFRAFGFPAGYDDGVWASGVLRGKTASGWLQLEDLKESGYRVQPGFSGGPVWDEQFNGVVGVVVAAAGEAETKAAFMIPTSLLLKTWPELASASLDVNDLVYLQEQLTMLETAQQAAPDPHRFKARIEDFKLAIANWEGRVEQQRQRIAQGLAEQRQQVAEVGQQPRDQKRVLVVGRCPLGTVEYFKNRRREQETLGRLLVEPTTRLVSIIGHGGMGKTALASKVLQDLERHHWPHTDQNIPVDGLVYLSTRTIGISLERLFLDCAKMLGEEAEKRLNAVWTDPKLNTEDKISHLLEALKEGVYVILLDNLEDLLDDQGQLVDQDLRLFFDRSLTTVHGARLLVTSRVTLAFKGEVMRFDRQVKLLDGLPVEDSVALLRELDPNGDYGLRDAPTEQLAQAVSLVHGVPRALEVLVSILANDPFATLAEVMTQFYQQADVVQGLIEENYKRLDSQARRVIEALAVFKRPMSSLAVDYLLEPFFPGLDVPSILRRLTRTNILTIDRATKTVVLHPIDQDYAYSQLPEEGAGELAYTRRALECRAADYYVQLRTPSETWKTIDNLEPQLAEFEHRIHAGDYQGASKILESINFSFFNWGYSRRVASMGELLLGRLEDNKSRGINHSILGRAYQTLGRMNASIAQSEQALAIFREMGAHRGEARTLVNLGITHRQLGYVEKEIECDEQAIIIYREIDDRGGEEWALGNLGNAYLVMGQVGRSIEYYEQALAISQQIGDPEGKGAWLGCKGDALCVQGRFEEALALYEEALMIARETGNRPREGLQLKRLGEAQQMLGHIEQAINTYQDALLIARAMDDSWSEGASLRNLGFISQKKGQIEQATQLFVQAVNIAPSHASKLALGTILLYKQDPSAKQAFVDVISYCQTKLEKTTGLYEFRYVLATALVGSTVCDPRWITAQKSERIQLLAPALAEYRRALEICAAPGVVMEALRDLELIHKAGVEGLELVFELLQVRLKNDH